jgi:hypothetical protein
MPVEARTPPVDAVEHRMPYSVVPYLDAFDPAPFVLADRRAVIGTNIIHPLLRELARNGLRLFVGHDLRLIARVQRENSERMRLVQTNNPDFHPSATPSDTNVMVLMRDGAALGCIAARLIWCERTLADEMASGRFWVDEPETMWTAEDRCVTEAYIAKTIRACQISFTGSLFLSREVTGGKVAAALMRLHNLWLLCHWRWSWAVGLVEGPLARRHAFEVYGATSLHTGVWRTRQGGGSEIHRYEIALSEREASMEAWLRPEMGDLDRPMGQPPKSILPLKPATSKHGVH